MERIENLSKQISNQKTELEYTDDGAIGIIYLNSKKDFNSLSSQMMKELGDKMLLLERDEKVKAIVLLSKQDKVFCPGGNIKEFPQLTYENQQYIDAQIEFRSHFFNQVKPVIAGVNGIAFGGGVEVLMACDIIILREDAKIGLPEINLGLMPGSGGCIRTAQLIGKSRASSMVMAGQPINAQRAYQLGFGQEIFEKNEKFHENVIDYVREKITSKQQSALILAKKAIKAAEELGVTQGNKFERDRLFSCPRNEAHNELMKFFQKQ